MPCALSRSGNSVQPNATANPSTSKPSFTSRSISRNASWRFQASSSSRNRLSQEFVIPSEARNLSVDLAAFGGTPLSELHQRKQRMVDRSGHAKFPAFAYDKTVQG